MTRSDAQVRADTFDAQLAAARRVLETREVKKSAAEPPIHRLLWSAGVRLPPPLFSPFPLNAAVMGSYFGAVWGAIMWVAMWSADGMDPLLALVVAAFAGLGFGLWMAFFYRLAQRKHDLPTWESLARPPEVDQPA